MTAAAQGIGRETALAFAAEGASVLAADIADDKVAPLTDALIGTRHLGVTKEAEIAARAETLGFAAESGIDEVVQAFIEDDLETQKQFAVV